MSISLSDLNDERVHDGWYGFLPDSDEIAQFKGELFLECDYVPLTETTSGNLKIIGKSPSIFTTFLSFIYSIVIVCCVFCVLCVLFDSSVVKARNLMRKGISHTTDYDPFVSVTYSQKTSRTNIAKRTNNPYFYTTFNLLVPFLPSSSLFLHSCLTNTLLHWSQ